MFKFTAIAIFMFGLSFTSAFGQLDLKLNTFGLLNKKVEIAAEAGYDKFSLELNVGYSYKPWGDGISINDEDISVPRSGIVLAFRPNFYLKKNSEIDGFHISPYVNYKRLTLKESEPIISTKAAAGLIFGLKKKITGQFLAQLEVGGGYNFLFKYKNKITGAAENREESIPFLGSLVKIDLPIRLSAIYRIGGG